MKSALIATLLAALCSNSVAQVFDQITRPIAVLTRASQIDTLLTELLIPAPPALTHVEVIDLTGNGFGPDDLVVTHPDMAMYPLADRVSATLREMMQSWELKADYRLDLALSETARMTGDAEIARDARAAISTACAAAIDQHYEGDDMDMRLIRRATGLRLELWNYDPAALHYRAPPPAAATCEPPELRQQFRFGQRVIVTAFQEPGACINVIDNGRTITMKQCG